MRDILTAISKRSLRDKGDIMGIFPPEESRWDIY